jgi:hypothetical protein
MPTIDVLAARASYYRHDHHGLTRLTAAQATAEIRAHVARDPRNRSTEAAPYGAVILHQGARSVRLEPWRNAMPKYLTAAQADQLTALAHATDPARYVEEAAGLAACTSGVRIPPAATNRLVRHGYLCSLDGIVSVSLAGVFALTWRYLKTSGDVPADEWGGVIAESLVDTFTPED